MVSMETPNAANQRMVFGVGCISLVSQFKN